MGFTVVTVAKLKLEVVLLSPYVNDSWPRTAPLHIDPGPCPLPLSQPLAHCSWSCVEPLAVSPEQDEHPAP